MPRKHKLPLKFRAHYIVRDAVELGVQYGIRRAFKHSDQPSEETIETAIVEAVMNQLYETLDFGE